MTKAELIAKKAEEEAKKKKNVIIFYPNNVTVKIKPIR